MSHFTIEAGAVRSAWFGSSGGPAPAAQAAGRWLRRWALRLGGEQRIRRDPRALEALDDRRPGPGAGS